MCVIFLPYTFYKKTKNVSVDQPFFKKNIQ